MKTLALASALLAPFLLAAEPVGIIFDTDMLTDVDDAGALACLHALADAGEARILATVSSTSGNASVGAVQVINTYYGRGGLPVGSPKGAGVRGDVPRPGMKPHHGAPLGGGHAKYRRLLANHPGSYTCADADDAPDATEVYRRTLASQPDRSVVVCTTGFLTNIRLLLESKGDAHSPLDGHALVAKKVKLWVAMACRYPRGREFNAMIDRESSRVALDDWPTPIVFADWNLGADVFAGRKIVESGDTGNPVRELFAASLPAGNGRSAWDELAVLIAVRGVERYFNANRGRYRMTGEDGSCEWIDAENSPHVRATAKIPKTELGRMIDELICRAPKSLGGE